jgi:hypothetical protein
MTVMMTAEMDQMKVLIYALTQHAEQLPMILHRITFGVMPDVLIGRVDKPF